MPTFLRSAPRRNAVLAALPLTLLVTGISLAACGSDDSSPIIAVPNDAAPNDATLLALPPVDADVADAADDADDAEVCDASIATVLNQAANSPYAACSVCLEKACSVELKDCYKSCSCTTTATDLFVCVGAGASPQTCLTSLLSGGASTGDLTDFVQCAFLCGNLCLPDTGAPTTPAVDSGSDAASAHFSDGGADGGDGGDAGHASDGGDGGNR